MHVLLVQYTVPIERIEATTAAHRVYLDLFVASGHILMSGRQVPPTGGVILAKFKHPEELKGFIAGDPFVAQGLAEYKVVEFVPGKHSSEGKAFLDKWAAANG
jgi:uncharacterized protein YciI